MSLSNYIANQLIFLIYGRNYIYLTCLEVILICILKIIIDTTKYSKILINLVMN